MSEEAIDSTKTFKVSRWGTIERSATARNEKPAGLGVKEHHIKGRTEVKLVYSRRVAKGLLETQRKMWDRKFVNKKSNVHEAFNSVSLLDYLDPSERHVGVEPDATANSFSLNAWTGKPSRPRFAC